MSSTFAFYFCRMARFTVLVLSPFLAPNFLHPAFLPLNGFPDHDTRAKLEILDMPYHPTLILPLHRPGVVRPGRQRVLSNVESGFPEKRRAYLAGQVANVRLVD